MKRRGLLKLGVAGIGSVGLASVAVHAASASNLPRVIVVGGGYGGATAAKYLRVLSAQKIEVVLIEPDAAFVSCPMSNLVVGGQSTMADITRSYDALIDVHGVKLLHDSVVRIDPAKRVATLASGTEMHYDKLVLSPGVEMMWDEVTGLREANRDGRILQAWKAGPETAALRRQLEAMPDGGVFAITIPESPYRCPPAPYERASLVAAYFKAAKPRSKILVLDANEEITSEGPAFRKVWAESYAGIIEYRPQYKASGVDAATNTVKFEIQDDVRADVLNVLPPMRAGAIAVQTGLANSNARWCNVDFPTFESTAAKHIHVIGDSIQIAPLMPKSGHMASSHGKVVAEVIVAQLTGAAADADPVLRNTCYSFVDGKRAMHVASFHHYVAAQKTFKAVPGFTSVSAAPSEAEAALAYAWASTTWADILG
jgi:sulfide dehydrogenase [flavocytochrome c] flavoprotein subunit